jgi:uncharacterized protein YuzE
MDIAYSVNRVPIRPTDERWDHVITSHDDMEEYYDDCLRVIEKPDLILKDRKGSFLAVKGYGAHWYLVVAYRELNQDDGLIKKNKRKVLANALGFALNLAKFPQTSFWVDFDEEADVLYISFKRPQRATNTVDLNDDGILLRYQGKEIVGITILDASER